MFIGLAASVGILSAEPMSKGRARMGQNARQGAWKVTCVLLCRRPRDAELAPYCEAQSAKQDDHHAKRQEPAARQWRAACRRNQRPRRLARQPHHSFAVLRIG